MEDFEEENENDLDEGKKEKDSTKMDLKIDVMEKKSIDNKRIRNIDRSKKRAVVDSVFDERTVFQLNKLLANRTIEKIEGIISAGKEAHVYLAYNQAEVEIALKIYKVDSNTSKWMRNYIIGDPRYKKIPNNISKIIHLWAYKEYKNLKRAYNVGLRVPKPLFIKDNILIMEYIGFGPTPAPQLKDIKKVDTPEDLLDQLLEFIKILYQKANLVHGDLSEFNILYHNHQPFIIDMSQAVSIEHPKAEIYLVRDIKNVLNYFKRWSVELENPEKFYYEVIGHEINSIDL